MPGMISYSIAIFSKEGRRALIDAAARKIFGLRREDGIGRVYNMGTGGIRDIEKRLLRCMATPLQKPSTLQLETRMRARHRILRKKH